MMKLSQITGKTFNELGFSNVQETDVSGSISGSEENFYESEVEVEYQGYDNTDRDRVLDESEDDTNGASSPDIRSTRTHSPELIELAMKWGATIGLTGKIINNKVIMSRKEFLKYSKNMTQKEALTDPLLYVMFRSEEQSEGSFWDFLGKFSREEDEDYK